MIRKVVKAVLIILILGMCIPQGLEMPVQGATSTDYHPDSFWFYPWGKSGTHKGVDIFAAKGTPVHSATKGIVVFTGTIGMGGKVVLILGPKWRLHYYAHLNEIHTEKWHWVSTESLIGEVGDSGSAAGKAPHLHYSIRTGIPYVWQMDGGPQGFKKMWFINPIDYLE